MDRGQSVLVACVIEKGAFSGERIFQFKLADGETGYSGVAPTHYCYNQERKPLGPDEPPESASIDGYVEAILVANKGEHMTVELPDGEAVRVKTAQVPFRQSETREPRYVPL